MADIICIGEAMLRNMSDSDFQSVGGAEMNVATAITQFGWDATWLSILPEDDKGIVNHAAYFGVDCLIFRSQGEVGEYTVLVDEGKVEYQRSESAFAKMDADDIPLREILSGNLWVHLTGITPLLGEGPKSLWNRALTFAELDGVKISLDINHRPTLASREELWQHIEPHLRKVHFLFLSAADLEWICEREELSGDSLEEKAQAVCRKWLINRIGCTIKEPFHGRRQGFQQRWSIIANARGVISTRENPVVHLPIEHLGSGDAWCASALVGYGDSEVDEWGARRADEVAALQQSTLGDQVIIQGEDPLLTRSMIRTRSQLTRAGVIPIIRSGDHEEARVLAERLIQAGAKALEFSFDTPRATALCSAFKEHERKICLGMGTVTDPLRQIMKGRHRRARFFFSAINPPEFIRECRRFNTLAVPGVANISEAREAISQGAEALKLFHAANNWTMEDMLKLREMYPRILLIPVGGLGPDDVDRMFAAGMDAVGIGAALNGMNDEELQTLFAESNTQR